MKKYFKTVYLEQEALKEILNRVPELKKFIKENERISIRINTDPFSSLVHTIVGQQLSNAVVDSLWNKMIHTFKKITPKTMANADFRLLCDIGLTANKANLIKKLAYDVVDKKLNLNRFKKMNEKEVSNILTQYKGIGEWTVQNFLIFSLYRPNVFPFNDLGIAKAIKLIFDNKHINEKDIKNILEKCDGMLTTLSICLWYIANNS